MKKILPIFITVLVLAMTLPKTLAQTKPTTKAILDSLEVLKKVGGFVNAYTYPPTAEETRYFAISQMLYSLPFIEAKKLINDNNKLARCYGFMVLTEKYFDSLTKADLNIFKDTSHIPLYTKKGIIDVGYTLGQLCEMAYTSTIERQNDKARQPEIIAAIKSFIKDNAKYPSSYESLSFKDYVWGGSDEDKFYTINHEYKIKQKDGAIVSAQNYFTLDKDYKIMIIETTRSNTIQADPPKIDEWMKSYGKN
jgi:hypothetical protein